MECRRAVPRTEVLNPANSCLNTPLAEIESVANAKLEKAAVSASPRAQRVRRASRGAPRAGH
eukprot:15443149-Alexandrium_andersonii.AAC.1